MPATPGQEPTFDDIRAELTRIDDRLNETLVGLFAAELNRYPDIAASIHNAPKELP
ncbi:hypothetical protein [Streptosporangium sp. KLBMP 9127]|nr:hypothetical protein [Streptosporangium sp. KLBMP 9127]